MGSGSGEGWGVDASETGLEGRGADRSGLNHHIDGLIRLSKWVRGAGLHGVDLVDERLALVPRRLQHLMLRGAFPNVLWYRGGLVFEAHRLLYHSA